MEGDVWKKIKITPEAMAEMVTRDAKGNLITIDWGDEDGEGFSLPWFTVHRDDNIVAETLLRLRQRIVDAQGAVLGMAGGVSRNVMVKLVDEELNGLNMIAAE